MKYSWPSAALKARSIRLSLVKNLWTKNSIDMNHVYATLNRAALGFLVLPLWLGLSRLFSLRK